MAGDKAQSKDKKPAHPNAKPVKAPKPKAVKPVEVAAVVEPAAPKVEVPRTPADPRLKFVKKLKARFLPKGPLRDRHKAILARWSSEEDNGSVTLEELKSLIADWRVSREKKSGLVK